MTTLLIIISITLFIIFAPLVLVAIGLPFKVSQGVREFRDSTSTEQFDLPNWLLWLQNPEDGLTGDSRGWYWNVYMQGKPDWIKMLIWSGWRNPWNYFKRVFMGVDIRQHRMILKVGQNHVRDDIGSEGFQVLVAEHKTKHRLFKPFGIYWVVPYKNKNGFMYGCRIGWKIKLSHNTPQNEEFELDYYKAPTFRIYINRQYH
ncbi:MAG: hypothetical protein COA63_010635 [Methylophaga sp.]|nr:hypothetical protein [Methylophaga sp.]